MDYRPFKTSIEHTKNPTQYCRIMPVASFTVAENLFDIEGYTINIPGSGRDMIRNIISLPEISYIIEQSCSGLLVRSFAQQDGSTFDVLYEIDLAVYLQEKMYTYCHLKYSEFLQGLIE